LDLSDTAAPRRFKITKRMLIEHGYSARCEERRAALEGQPSQNHSEACRKRALDSIGGKNAPEVEAQRKRFDAFVEKAATKEDSEELQREKKRVRFGDQTPAEVPAAPEEVTPIPSTSSSNNTNSSSKRGPDIVEHIDRIVPTTFQEQRGEKRLEDTGAEREVRARIREARGQKRVPEDDGRADLDEAALEMARNAAEAGLARLALARKAVRVDAVAPQPTQMTYAAPQPTQMTYAAPRWSDVESDENLQSDPLLQVEKWKRCGNEGLEADSNLCMSACPASRSRGPSPLPLGCADDAAGGP